MICRLCNKKIMEKIDPYCIVEDYREGKLRDKGYYHTKCYVDKIKETQDASMVLKKAMNMLNSLGRELNLPEDKKEVILK